MIARLQNRWTAMHFIKKLTILIYIVIVLAGFLVLNHFKPSFFALNNIKNILIQGSATGIMTFGMTFVLITCGMDLSVTPVMSFASVMGAVVMQKTGNAILGILAILLTGILCGSINGISVAQFKMFPFVVTMAMMIIAQAAGTLISNSRTIPVPQEFIKIATGTIWGIPIPVFLLFFFAIFFQLLLTKTTFGRGVYAIGINPDATTPCGLPSKGILFSAYAISGFTAAVGGIILTAKLGSASLSTASDSATMDVVCAAILGGVSIYGGTGSIVGPLAGAMFIVAMQNAFNLFGVNYYVALIVKGCIILAATLSDTILAKQRG